MKLNLETSKKHFEDIIMQRIRRVEKIDGGSKPINFDRLDKIIIGVAPGDGIGPTICGQAYSLLKRLLESEINSKKVEFRDIPGLTFENRKKLGKTLPPDTLDEIKKCRVLLKGPTTTPQMGAGLNMESANVVLRRELDLFANVRPIRVPELGIDWTFFRENTEGSYAVGSNGIQVHEQIYIDFCVTTEIGNERIIRAAFEYAKKTGKKKVTAVTKANVIKLTDGRFLMAFNRIAAEYPQIEPDEKYVDIMAANLIDKNKQRGFEVLVMPNLYGDILTDEAAAVQGGVGTAGSANIGNEYAMFEAVHGSAPDLIKAGLERFADPASILRASVMMLSHIGYAEHAAKLEAALDKCTRERIVVSSGPNGVTNEEYIEYLSKELFL